MIDFRSDTVTKPSAAMKDAMFAAPVGDDVFGEDPSIIELEQYAANLFGKEAGLFCSSGTQTNQIAINVHVQPGGEVICHEESHIYKYEGGGIAKNSGASVRLLDGNRGRLTLDEIEKWIRTNTEEYDEVTLIGSGGNINKLFKMSGKSQDKPLSYIYMNSQYAFLNSLTYEQRISELGLNSDRADVIIPATRIYLNAMKWSGARNIYVPKIGLADGIVKAMYYGKIK